MWGAPRPTQPLLCLMRLHTAIVVVQAYRDEVISAGKVRQILGMATRMEVEEFLKQKGIDLHYDETDLESDRQTHQQLRSQGKLPA
ncbi:UPF0175 family protein [Vacuolonema iberomarrocanum]|uniref:UPF0175 family protein n=1 Tax=Vacuolonema iberomarrocanum TaxID=3454632 RepID=UPI003F6E4135